MHSYFQKWTPIFTHSFFHYWPVLLTISLLIKIQNANVSNCCREAFPVPVKEEQSNKKRMGKAPMTPSHRRPLLLSSVYCALCITASLQGHRTCASLINTLMYFGYCNRLESDYSGFVQEAQMTRWLQTKPRVFFRHCATALTRCQRYAEDTSRSVPVCHPAPMIASELQGQPPRLPSYCAFGHTNPEI